MIRERRIGEECSRPRKEHSGEQGGGQGVPVLRGQREREGKGPLCTSLSRDEIASPCFGNQGF